MIQLGTRKRPAPAGLGALLAGVLAGVLTLTACTGDQPGSSGRNRNYVEGTGEVTRVAPGDRDEAPDISGETLDGDEVSLSDYAGQVVVINVWASWCAPCRAEAPHLAAVAKDTADQGVSFLGINIRDLDRVPAQRFERTYDIPYPSLYDPSSRQILQFPDGTLNPQAIPSTVIVDRQGRIAVRALTALAEDELRDALAPVIAEK